MVSYALKTTVAVALVIVLSLGAAWLASLGAGPVLDPERLDDDRPPATRVEYRTSSRMLQTPVVDIPAGGSIQLPDLDVPFLNVSGVRINLLAVTDDPAFGDMFSVSVVAPDDEARQGTLQSPQVSPAGYQISNTVVQEWARDPVPPRETYATRSQDKALRWAAENHTESSSRGLWTAQVELQPPPAGLRNVNVTLTFTFTVYEAFAFPDVATTEGGQADNNTSSDSQACIDCRAGAPAAEAQAPSTNDPHHAKQRILPAFPRPHQNPLETDPRGARQ